MKRFRIARMRGQPMLAGGGKHGNSVRHLTETGRISQSVPASVSYKQAPEWRKWQHGRLLGGEGRPLRISLIHDILKVFCCCLEQENHRCC
jgi:hypothetical protein